MEADRWFLTKTETFEAGGGKWAQDERTREFEDFNEARDAFRRLAREFATTEGGVFDGNGNIRNLQRVFDVLKERVDGARRGPDPNSRFGSMVLRGAPEVAFMAGDFESATKVPSALRSWLLDMGAYDRNPLPEFKWTDWVFGVVSRQGSLAVGMLDDCGRTELYDAQVYTNAFDMADSDGDYEFSVRATFDACDSGAGALRIRLSRGSTGEGRFWWPEDAGPGWPCELIDAGSSPCLEGEIDGAGYATVDIRPRSDGRGLGGERLLAGCSTFAHGIIGVAESQGRTVDARRRASDPEGEWENWEIDCYSAGDTGPWSKFRVNVMCSTRPIAYACPPEVERPPIRVYCAGSYDDYPQALAEITRLMGEHAQRVGLDIETRSGDG